MTDGTKRARVRQLAREAAARTGQSPIDAIRTVLERYVAQLAAEDPEREHRNTDLLSRVDAEMTPQTRADLLGDDLYDADDLPR